MKTQAHSPADSIRLASALADLLARSAGRWSALGCAARLLPLLLLLTLPAVVQAQFNYTTNNGAITITGYTGPGGAVTIPSTITGRRVTHIGDRAFYEQTSLTSFTLPNTVTSIGGGAFADCSSLNGVYFQGNAPSAGSVFYRSEKVTVYYLPGTTGWGPTFDDRPTALWSLPNPLIPNFGLRFGVQTNQFGFTISWATNVSVVVEACTDLSNPVWTRVSTNTLTGGSSYFSDPQWTNHPARFYRLRSP